MKTNANDAPEIPTLRDAWKASDEIELSGVYLSAMLKALQDKFETIQSLAERPRQEADVGTIREAAMHGMDLLAIASDFATAIANANDIAGHHLSHHGNLEDEAAEQRKAA